MIQLRFHMLRRGSLRAASLVCAVSVPVLAQEATQEITVVGKQARATDSAALQVGATHLGARQMATENPMGLADAVRHAPGASVQQTTPSQATIYVRGLSGREVAHYVDGIRLNSTIFRAGNNPFIGLVDVLSLRSIELLPGANSVTYGGEALGGAILMTSGTPPLTLRPARSSFALRQIFASNPWSTATRVEGAHATPDWAVRLGISHTAAGPIVPGGAQLSPIPESYHGLERASDGSYHATLSEEQRGTEYQFGAGDIALRAKLAPRRFVVLRGQHAFVPRLVRYDQVTPRFKRETPDRAVAELTPLTRSAASLRFEQGFDSAILQRAELLLGWQQLSEHATFRGLDEVCPTAPDAEACSAPLRLVPAPSASTEANRSDALSILSRVELLDRKLTLGLSFSRDIVTSSAQRTSTTGVAPSQARFPDGSSSNELGAFGRTHLRVVGPVHLDLGARFSVFNADIRARSAIQGAPGTSAFSLTLADYAAEAALVYEVAAGARFAARVGRAVRAPNVQDLATLGSRAGGRYQVPNLDLGTEHGYSGDVSFDLSRRLYKARSSIFFQRYADALVLAPTSVEGASATPEGDRYYRSINASSVEVIGVETYVESRIVDPVSVFGRGLAMRGVQHNPSGTDLPSTTPADRTPPPQGDAGVRWYAPRGLSLEAMVSCRLRQDRLNVPVNVDDNRIPVGGTPGFTTLHLRTTWTPEPNWQVQLNLDNLTNELVLDHGSGVYRAGFSMSAGISRSLDND